MFLLFKDDPWGNKIPYMAATKEVADRIVREKKEITRIVEIPRNVQTLIKM